MYKFALIKNIDFHLIFLYIISCIIYSSRIYSLSVRIKPLRSLDELSVQTDIYYTDIYI